VYVTKTLHFPDIEKSERLRTIGSQIVVFTFLNPVDSLVNETELYVNVAKHFPPSSVIPGIKLRSSDWLALVTTGVITTFPPGLVTGSAIGSESSPFRSSVSLISSFDGGL